jgi:hypothetical protein
MRRCALVVLAVAGFAARAEAKLKASVTAGGVEYQVSCERCDKGADCLSVKAVAKDVPAAKLIVDKESHCRGVEDRLEVEISAREFKLSPALSGVLIKQESGGEAIAHNYWLVALIDGKLGKLWDAMYSTHEVVSIESYTLKTTDTDGNGRPQGPEVRREGLSGARHEDAAQAARGLLRGRGYRRVARRRAAEARQDQSLPPPDLRRDQTGPLS